MTTSASLLSSCASACSITTNRSEEHTSELQSRLHLVCRLLLEKKKNNKRVAIERNHRDLQRCSQPGGQKYRAAAGHDYVRQGDRRRDGCTADLVRYRGEVID